MEKIEKQVEENRVYARWHENESAAFKFSETIADIPFIGKTIDKNKLAKDRKELLDELTNRRRSSRK